MRLIRIALAALCLPLYAQLPAPGGGGTAGGGGSGESNTASNIGAGGVGPFDAKVGVDLQFRNIQAGSARVSVTDDSGDNEIEIDTPDAVQGASALDTASRIPYVSSPGALGLTGIDTTVLGYLANLTSDAQAQINAKVNDPGTVTSGLAVCFADTTGVNIEECAAGSGYGTPVAASGGGPFTVTHNLNLSQGCPVIQYWQTSGGTYQEIISDITRTNANECSVAVTGTAAGYLLYVIGGGVGGGAGSGDVEGPASATDNNVATFDGTTGKLIQDGGKALPSGAIVGTSDTQTLSAKTLTTPIIGSYAVGSLPTPSAGALAIVTDATAAGDCTTGGGSAKSLCRYSGSAWQPLGDGATSSPLSAGTGIDAAELAGGTVALDTTLMGSRLTGSGSQNIGTVNAGVCGGSFTISVSGAASNDVVHVSTPIAYAAGWRALARVSEADTVQVCVSNGTGSNGDPGDSETFNVIVFKAF